MIKIVKLDCKIERKGSLQMLENPNSTEHSKELKEEPEQQKNLKKIKEAHGKNQIIQKLKSWLMKKKRKC